MGCLPWNKSQLRGSASWRVTDLTPKEVRVTVVRVPVKTGTSTAHESICYRDKKQEVKAGKPH